MLITERRAVAWLFKIDGRRFVITAGHIFDDLDDLSKLAYPENPVKGGLHTSGSRTVVKAKEEHIDVAAIELKCVETIDRFEKS